MKTSLTTNNGCKRTDLLDSKGKETGAPYTNEKLFQSLKVEFSKLDTEQQNEYEAYIQSIINVNQNKEGKTMKEYKHIEENLEILNEMVYELTESILDEEFSKSDVYKYADYLAMFTGVWAERYDCADEPFTPEDDVQYATDVWENLSRFKESINNSALPEHMKLLSHISEAESVLKTIMHDINAYLCKHEDDEPLDLLAHQLIILFNQHGMLTVNDRCVALTGKLRNRAEVIKILSADSQRQTKEDSENLDKKRGC